MAKLKGLYKRFFVTSIIAVVILTSAIPTFAFYTPSDLPAVEVDGLTYIPIVLEATDFQALYNSGDVSFTVDIECFNYANSIRNIATNALYSVNIGNEYRIPGSFGLSESDLISVQVPNRNAFIIEFPAVLINSSVGSSVEYEYRVSFPFSFYFLGQEVKNSFFSPGQNITNPSFSMTFENAEISASDEVFNITLEYDRSYNLQWSETEPLLQNLVVGYGYVPSRVATVVEFVSRPNIPYQVDSIRFVGSLTGSGTNTSPIGMIFSDYTVYLLDEVVGPDPGPDDPTYADVVTDYLDEIVNLSPANQYKVTALRNKLTELDSKLDDLSSDMIVEIPDVDDLIDDIDDDLIDGSTQYSDMVVSPILNSEIMILLFTGLFVVATMKLVLFGSGKS